MIYLDHNATTPIAPEVREAMLPYLTDEWGNPSSAYRFGSKLKTAIETAREQVSRLIGALPQEVLFTSCATESNNAAIHAALKSNPSKRHIVTSVVEHSSVLTYCTALENDGYRVTRLPVDREGLLSVPDLENTITEETAIVSLMWANNETGVLFPIREIARTCREHGVLFHCDAVQAVGKVAIDLCQISLDYLSLSAHKIYGPKGIAALYVRQDSPFVPLIHGGNQEHGRRGGTENIPNIVGLGKAAELAQSRLKDYSTQIRSLRDELETEVLKSISGTEINGHRVLRLPNTANIAFPGIESDALMALLDNAGICASKGSACLGNSDGVSHVISAMKVGDLTARQSLRFSLGFGSTQGDVSESVSTLIRNVAALRA
jgi:cysteine desulfurase